MSNDTRDLNLYHNKGQRDAAEERSYKLPHNLFFGAFNSSSESARNSAYEQGYRNGKKK